MDSPDPALRNGVARDIVFLEAVEVDPVVVHGGGKAITRAMEKAGLAANFIQGMRVTDEAAVKIVDDVLSREINPEIVAAVQSLGGQAVGFAGTDIFKCRKALARRQGKPGSKARHRLRRRGGGSEHRAVEGVHLERFHAGHQPTARGEDRQDLQLQRRRGRRTGCDRAQRQAVGVHE